MLKRIVVAAAVASDCDVVRKTYEEGNSKSNCLRKDTTGTAHSCPFLVATKLRGSVPGAIDSIQGALSVTENARTMRRDRYE